MLFSNVMIVFLSPRRLRKAIRTAQNRGFTSPSLSEATELLDNLESSCNTTLSFTEDEKSDAMGTETRAILEPRTGDIGHGDTDSPAPQVIPLEDTIGPAPVPQPEYNRQGCKPQVEDVPLHLALPAPISAEKRRRIKNISREVNEYIIALLAEKDQEHREQSRETPTHIPNSIDTSTSNKVKVSQGYDSKQPMSPKEDFPSTDNDRKSDGQRIGPVALEMLPSETKEKRPVDARPKRDGKSISPTAAVARARRAAAAASSSSPSPQRRYRDRGSPSTRPSNSSSPKRWLSPSNASPNRSSLSPRWLANSSSATASATTSPGASSADCSPGSSPRSRSRRSRVRHEIRALHSFVHAQGSGRVSTDVRAAASKSGSATHVHSEGSSNNDTNSSSSSSSSSAAAAASDTSRVQSI